MIQAKLLEKFMGIGAKSAKALVAMGVTTVSAVAAMNVEQVARVIKRPQYILELAKYIAQRVTPAFLARATRRSLELARVINGVGRDFAIVLWVAGIKSLFQITPGIRLRIPGLPAYLLRRFEIMKAQVQLSLVVGLTSWHARKLVHSGIASLAEISKSSSSRVSRVLMGVSKAQAEIWIELATKLVQANILTYRRAANLPLAKRILGIGPEIGVALYVLGMKNREEFIRKMNEGIRDMYFPWITNQQIEAWLMKGVLVWTKKELVPKCRIGYGSWRILGQRITCMELWLSARFPTQAAVVSACAGFAYARSITLFPAKDYTTNAFLHALWSCSMCRGIELVTPEIGANVLEESIATLFAWAHEYFPENVVPEMKMDLHNNQIGRDLAFRPEEVIGDIPGVRLAFCEARVLEAMRQGKLQLIP